MTTPLPTTSYEDDNDVPHPGLAQLHPGNSADLRQSDLAAQNSPPSSATMARQVVGSIMANNRASGQRLPEAELSISHVAPQPEQVQYRNTHPAFGVARVDIAEHHQIYNHTE